MPLLFSFDVGVVIVSTNAIMDTSLSSDKNEKFIYWTFASSIFDAVHIHNIILILSIYMW